MRFPAPLLLLGCLIMPLCSCDNSPQLKIGIVDDGRIMRDCEVGKAGLKKIEALQAKMQSQLDEIQAKLEKNPSDEAAMREMQKVFGAAQQQMQAEGENIANQIFDAIQKSIDNYRKSNGYAVLIRQDALASYDPALDVTDEVMREANKLSIEFKPLTPINSGNANIDPQQETEGAAQKPQENAGK